MKILFFYLLITSNILLNGVDKSLIKPAYQFTSWGKPEVRNSEFTDNLIATAAYEEHHNIVIASPKGSILDIGSYSYNQYDDNQYPIDEEEALILVNLIKNKVSTEQKPDTAQDTKAKLEAEPK